MNIETSILNISIVTGKEDIKFVFFVLFVSLMALNQGN